jgi:hypothetical protein
MAARFAELSENQLSCFILEEKNAENKKATKPPSMSFASI